MRGSQEVDVAEQPGSAVRRRDELVCPWCGATNPPGTERCVVCGSWLVSEVRAPGDESGTIIDVSDAEPRVVEVEPADQYTSTWFGESRGFVIQGPRGCILAGIVLVLFVCVQCVLAFLFFRWIF
jgi:hypothetical protein